MKLTQRYKDKIDEIVELLKKHFQNETILDSTTLENILDEVVSISLEEIKYNIMCEENKKNEDDEDDDELD